MNGNKLEFLDEIEDIKKMKRYLEWELSNIQMSNDEGIKKRIYEILCLGIHLPYKKIKGLENE